MYLKSTSAGVVARVQNVSGAVIFGGVSSKMDGVSQRLNFLLGNLGLQKERLGVGSDHGLEVLGLDRHDLADAGFEVLLVLPHGGSVTGIGEEHRHGWIARGRESGTDCEKLGKHGDKEETTCVNKPDLMIRSAPKAERRQRKTHTQMRKNVYFFVFLFHN